MVGEKGGWAGIKRKRNAHPLVDYSNPTADQSNRQPHPIIPYSCVFVDYSLFALSHEPESWQVKARKGASKQATSEQARMKTSEQAIKDACKRAGKQASRQASKNKPNPNQTSAVANRFT